MRNRILLSGGATGAIAACLLAATPAFAEGTQAGDPITNNVTVNYEVGSIPQDEETAQDIVTVDRKIDLVVARTDDTATAVTPGATNQAVTFQIENDSNDTLDFALAVTQVASTNPAGITGTDSFDATGGFTFYLDDGDGIFNAADGAAITHLDALAPDSPVVVHAVANIPTGLTNAQRAAVVLTATARENDAAATLGAAFTEATTNTAGVDTIFADGAGSTDGTRDASHSATDDYVVLTAGLTAAKTSKIVASPIAGDTSATNIPGATIEYCIAVTNAPGGAAATSIAINDPVPAEVTYDAGFGILVGGADCDTPGGGAGTYNAVDDEVDGTIATLAAGTTQTLIFRATID